MSLATILGIPGNYGMCDYIKEVWEETRYCKPLEITRKFSNDQTITKAGRVKSGENEENQEENYKWEAENEEEAVPEGEQVKEAQAQGGQNEKEAEGIVTESVEEFFNAEDGGKATTEDASTAAA
ncbi:hypothetical protein Dimus_013317 [Dionaea muscipula]